MIRIIAGIAGFALILAGAVVHGAATHRWAGLTTEASRSAAAMNYKIRFGDYESTDIPSELPVKERSSVACRRYLSASGKPGMVVSITSGPPGAVSTHTPDVCYPGSGFKTVKAPQKETLDLGNGRTATCYVAEFEKKTATSAERHRIRWAWTVNGTWNVPDYARFAYLRSPELYKIYIVASMPVTDGEPEAETPAMKAFAVAALEQYGTLLVK